MINTNLNEQLKRLRLTGMLETLSMRFEQAQKDNLPHHELFQLVLQDEIQRRDIVNIAKRLQRAHFEEAKDFQSLQLEHYKPATQQVINGLKNAMYLKSKQHIILMGATGTGKTHLAQALGNLACRYGYSVRFIRANAFFRQMQASRADHGWEKTFKAFLVPELLILDDFGLKTLSNQEAEDVYELIADRANKGSFIITSNRTVDAWVKLFPDPVMANAALDRLANNAQQIILEGESFRKKNRPNQDNS
jgi:DNA replication protein DnaC